VLYERLDDLSGTGLLIRDAPAPISICSPEGEPRSGQHWKSLDVRATRWPDTLPRHSG
jgi:hypothetical protein